ncbi:MAG: DUF4113 domain-containing protein, partial [Chitinophagaceae bacterium]
PAKKGICTARSFGMLVTSKDHLQEAVSNYASNVARKLRAQKGCAKQINVFIQTNPFRTGDKQYFRSIDIKLPVASNSTHEMIRHALNAVDIIYVAGFRYVKAGVIATEIVPEQQVQKGLFDTVDRTRDKTIMNTMDQVNKSFGKDLVRFAVQGYEKKWKLKAAHLSKRYTTNINELLTIKN